MLAVYKVFGVVGVLTCFSTFAFSGWAGLDAVAAGLGVGTRCVSTRTAVSSCAGDLVVCLPSQQWMPGGGKVD